MSKQVQIPTTLFLKLCEYLETADDERGTYLHQELSTKLDKIIAHEYFTRYKKSIAPEDREKYRQIYLDTKGIPKSYRSETEIPYNKL